MTERSRIEASDRLHRVVRIAFEWVLFITVAIWSTWPLALHLNQCLPLGCEQQPVVPVFNLWTMWWNVDRVSAGYAGYWQAPIFYPAENAFAYSEPQSLTGLLAWPLWKLLPSAEAAYNVLLLGHLALNGWATAFLLKSWRIRPIGALACGVMVQLLPVVHWQLGIVQLVPLWGILFFIFAMTRFAGRQKFPTSLRLGLSAAVVYLLCTYYGLMLSILCLTCFPLLLGRRLLHRRTHGFIALAVLSSGLAIAPIAVAQWKMSQSLEQSPPRELVERLSAKPVHYLRTPWPQWLAIAGIEPATPEDPWALSPGTFKLLAATAGVIVGLSGRRNRRLVVFLAGMLIVAVLLSLGPTIEIRGVALWDALRWYPGFAQMRNIYRFAVFAQVFTVLLAAIAIDRCSRFVGRLLRKKFSRRGSRKASVVLTAILGGVLILETIPGRPGLFCMGREGSPGWVSWLDQNTIPSAVIAVFPFPPGDRLEDYAPTATWMYWQTRHERRMINGYSGVFPDEFAQRELLMRNFPDDTTLERLREDAVSFVVVHGAQNEQLYLAYPAIPRVYWDGRRQVGIYRVDQRPDELRQTNSEG